jgi:3-hydroxy-9,10-secoandrosta-1,3,5(10)-triene-9,17-dione monooxygenase reductase component
VTEVTGVSTGPDVDPVRFRQVFGHFCTGVTVVTSALAGEPVGFACQAFAALSLQPPLVLFCPAVASATWPRIERAGHFCVNVLAEGQRSLSRVFGTSGAGKFTGVRWSSTVDGSPVLDGVLAWAACRIEAVYPAGDHHLVVGRVTELGECREGRPLLFYKGQYTAATTLPDVASSLLAWPRHTDWI